MGNVIASIDALGRTTQFTYDKLNRQVVRTNALGSMSTIAYDAVGNLISQTDELGRTTQYVYNNFDRQVALIDMLRQLPTTLWATSSLPRMRWAESLRLPTIS
jgi:YD repeat-containing protein